MERRNIPEIVAKGSGRVYRYSYQANGSTGGGKVNMENVKPVEIGRLVASDRRGDRNTKLMIVVDDRSGIVQEADKAAGFQLAETRGTLPTLVFFQVPEADLFTVRNWGGTVARTVKFWEVDTVVVDGVIMAGVGAPLPDGMVRA